MTVPVQRGAGSEDSTVLGMVLDGVREVKETVRAMQSDINSRLDSFDQRYIPRAEYEARHSDVRNLITRQEARIEAEAKSRGDLEDKLTSGRRWAIGACLTAALLIVGLLSLVLANLPH